jgi:ketosteroid isomerase-like protein
MPVAPATAFKRALDCLLAYDIDAYADLFAENAVIEWPFAPPDLQGRVEGRDAIRSAVGRNLEMSRAGGRRLVGLHDVVVREVAGGNEVVVEFEVEILRPDGDTDRLPYVHILRVDEAGKIASLRDYFGEKTVRMRSG